MKNKNIIPYSKFVDAFEKIGWKQQGSGDARYSIFVDPNSSDIWTRIPKSGKDQEYEFYQKKNTLLLLYALNLSETRENILDLNSQLKNYNYKLISRILTKSNQDVVPYELANLVPEKNIDAFRYFYRTKTKKNKAIPIEKFELNHTEVGSFVIPVSIKVDEAPNTLVPVQSDMSIQLHRYLDAIKNLTSIPRKSSLDFAERVMADEIDSKIVKDFYGADNSIAKYKAKYEDRIDGISIGSRGSALLDYELPEDEKKFIEVDLGNVQPVDEEYIAVLEDKEIKANDSTLEMFGAKVDVLVEGLDNTGRAKFTVVSIDGHEVSKPFKAASVKLSKAKLDKFAAYFINGNAISVVGDIEKAKGKVGQIIIDTLEDENRDKTDSDDNRIPLM